VIESPLMHNNATHGILLSVVAPAHNEADNLPDLVAATAKALGHLDCAWEIIIVDDGSTDQTPLVLAGLLSQYPMLRVLRLRQRSGQLHLMQGLGPQEGPL
jgi:dolichol-phosphate mannosyltransferase